jgi:uncharacterized membrane protein YcjF (UPF0283 family)
MRASSWVRIAIGVVMVLVGGVWIGQGAGWIHGSFMTGEALWLVIGLVVAALGLWLIVGVISSRRTRVPPRGERDA